MYRGPDGQYITDDRKVAVDVQYLWAESSVIEQANQALAAVESRVRLKMVPTSLAWIRFDAQGRGAQWSQYIPDWQKEETKGSIHVELNKPNETVRYTRNPADSYITWSDCHRNSMTVMGATGDRGKDSEPERPGVRLRDQSADSKTFLLSPMGGGISKNEFKGAGYTDQHAHRGAFATLAKIIPVRDRGNILPQYDTKGVPVPTSEKIKGLWKAYTEEMAAQGAAAWQCEHWINAFLHPEIGEAICMLPPKESPGFCSTYAWNDLKGMLRNDAEVWQALGLNPDDDPPPLKTLGAALKKLEPVTFDELMSRYGQANVSEENVRQDMSPSELRAAERRLFDRRKPELAIQRRKPPDKVTPVSMEELQATEQWMNDNGYRILATDVWNRVCDVLIRRHMSRKLKDPACTIERRATLISQLDGDTPLIDIIRSLSDAELTAMIKTEVINRNWNGRRRDDLTVETLDVRSDTAEAKLADFRTTALVWKDPWNFHWAGVVLVSGHDYVTLENFSVEAEDYPNRRWLFKMYRRIDAVEELRDCEAQSFHGHNMLSGGFGDLALTLSYKFFKPQRAAVNALRTQLGSASRITLNLPKPQLPPPPTQEPVNVGDNNG
ncbi:MAG: hypothetical protein U1D55_09480 [Phycisphaerae bacterium]